MGDQLEKFFDFLNVHPPGWVFIVVPVVVAALLGLKQIVEALGTVGSGIATIFRFLRQRLPGLGRRDDRAGQPKSPRALFAEYVRRAIDNLNDREGWHDSQFIELEAEVRMRAGRGNRRMPFRLLPTGEGSRRVRLLTKALANGSEQIVLLEGGPGSGKSVTLRHLATLLAKRAAESTNPNAVIPLYVDLRRLEPRGSPVNGQLIREFVLEDLNRGTADHVQDFLNKTFDEGIQNGTWMFLFDSFDEIPAILSSTDSDETTAMYAEAIDKFLSALSACNGIIASRPFRVPKGLTWLRFEVVPLSEKRKHELINRVSREREDEVLLRGGLPDADQGVKELSENPLFLRLLCEYVAAEKTFPENSHIVFDAFVQRRLSRDEQLLKRSFGMDSAQVQTVAEQLAYCMSSTPIGTTPRRQDLLQTMVDKSFPVDEKTQKAMDALERARLALSPEPDAGSGLQRPFRFRHNRLREYFATNVVLEDSRRVKTMALLTDDRWRESAVAMLELQQPKQIERLLKGAARLLRHMANSFPELPEHLVTEGDTATATDNGPAEGFSWPNRSWHLLDILNSAFARRYVELPANVQNNAARILVAAFKKGHLFDQKRALEVAGVLPLPILTWLLRESYRSRSEWLKDAAYRQVARLRPVPTDLAREIRRALVSLSATGRLRRDRMAVEAQIKRLDRNQDYVQIVRLLVAAPIVDLIAHAILLAILFARSIPSPASSGVGVFALLCLASHASFYVLRASPFFSDQRPPTWLAVSRLGGSSLGLIIAALVFVAARFYLLLAVIALSPGRVTVLQLVGYTYLMTWSVSALIAATRGHFLQVWWWPLIQVAAVEAATVLLGRIARTLTLRSTLQWIAIIVGSLGIGGAIGGGFVWLSEKLSDSGLGMVGWILYYTLVGGSLVLAAWTVTTTWGHDLRWYWQWRRSAPEKIELRQFLAMLGELRTRAGAVRLARDVGSQARLVANKEAKDGLIDLVRLLEYLAEARSNADTSDRKHRELRQVADWRSQAFLDWLGEGDARENTLSRLGDEFLDELAKIIDQWPAQEQLAAAAVRPAGPVVSGVKPDPGSLTRAVEGSAKRKHS